MPLSNLEIFNDWAYNSMSEAIAQQIELFNTATRGGLTLTSGSNTGDYNDEAYWKRIPGLIRRRDAYGSGAVAPINLDQLLSTSVKVAGGTPAVNMPPSMLRWINRSPDEAGLVYGEQLAEGIMQDMVNVAIGAVVAGLKNEATNIHDGTAGTADLSGLNLAAAKMGDRSADIACWLMHSKALHDIYGTALVNTERLFTFGTVNIMQDGFGRPLIQTDSADLFFDNAGTNNYDSVGLVSGGVIVSQNSDFDQNTETSNGDENILRTIQSEWSYNVGLKSMPWDKTNGGASPTDAELRTGTNWDSVASSNKDLPGVILTSL